MINKTILINSESYVTPEVSEVTVVNFGSVLCTSTGSTIDDWQTDNASLNF